MEHQAPIRGEVIMAGIGGKGVLLAGQVLAGAAASRYEHLVWFPSYSAVMRGGSCECTVIFSSRRIGSMVLEQADCVVVMEPSQLPPSLPRVRSGGLLITEKAGMKGSALKGDFKTVTVPAVELALQATGESQNANFVMLGAYVGTTKVLPAEIIEKELEKRLGGRPKVLAKNQAAFRKGLEAVAGHQ